MWAYYGDYQKGSNGKWKPRNFDVQGDNNTSVPEPNDKVTAIGYVYGHDGPTPVWDSEIKDVKLGPEIGDIKPGDKAVVLERVDINQPKDDYSWYFIRLKRLPKE